MLDLEIVCTKASPSFFNAKLGKYDVMKNTRISSINKFEQTIQNLQENLTQSLTVCIDHYLKYDLHITM